MIAKMGFYKELKLLTKTYTLHVSSYRSKQSALVSCLHIIRYADHPWDLWLDLGRISELARNNKIFLEGRITQLHEQFYLVALWLEIINMLLLTPVFSKIHLEHTRKLVMSSLFRE